MEARSTGAAILLRLRHFIAVAALLPLNSCQAPPQVVSMEFADGRHSMLVMPLDYHVGTTRHVISVPDGFVTDFASVPRVLWSAYPPHEMYSRAAVIHDYLYWIQTCTRKQADNILMIAMKESNVSRRKRNAVYKGVRLGGQNAWDANARERTSGLPRVIPNTHRNIPPNLTWPDFRRQLKNEGIKDPAPGGDTGYCATGDSAEVPVV